LLKEAVAAKNSGLADRLFPSDTNQAYNPKRGSLQQLSLTKPAPAPSSPPLPLRTLSTNSPHHSSAKATEELANLSVEAFNRKRRSAGLAPVRLNHGRSALDVECDLTTAVQVLKKPKAITTIDDSDDDTMLEEEDSEFALACRLSEEQERLEQLNRKAYEALLSEHKGHTYFRSPLSTVQRWRGEGQSIH
jgi:hypothetical protein